MKYIYTAILAVLFCFISGVPSFAEGQSPTTQLQPVIEEVIAILEDADLKGDEHKRERRSKIMAAIANGFDFREMSQRVLGRTWYDLSEDEKDYFIEQFTKLLENVYIGKLESYGGRSVSFVAERIKGKRAQVTTMVPYEGSEIPIHYIMQRELDTWMVYDINIEGVSLVRNYMEQFRSILRTEKYEGLIKTIEEKNRTFAEEKNTN
jgi:phospholipid transport system substrate-binding protein